MGKRIYWVLVILIALVGVATMVHYGSQPRPTSKIKLSKFENHTMLANSLLSNLREEIKNSPVMFLGLDPDIPEHYEIWKEFLKQNHESGMAYDLVVVELELTTDLFPDAQRVETKNDFSAFMQGIEAALGQGRRVAVILPLTYSVQMIEQNMAHIYNTKVQVPATSISITGFPRNREQEKDMVRRCMVEGVDETGLGPFGCLVAQTARANYRKRFEPGNALGLVNMVGPRDYLVFYTREK
ncbi:MAG: hypothetical protein ACXWC9_05910 [Pseudobdellovibrionaceae bacterium]